MAAALPATLTLREARATLEALGAAAPAAGWRIDAAPLAAFDSSALAVLLELRRAARAAGAEFVVDAAPQPLRELAGLYGVAALLGLGGDAPQAPPA